MKKASVLWIVVMLMLLYIGVEPAWAHDVKQNITLSSSSSSAAAHRKLLQDVEAPDPDFNRVGPWKRCSQSDIHVNQGQTSPLPNGIPTYTVIVMNTCSTGCAIGGIHLSCGWFSSARLINPSVFKRISYDDCLVNDGNSLPSGASLSFQYANTFSYPLSVSSVSC